jgi:rhodanese-related sulfurtransferase
MKLILLLLGLSLGGFYGFSCRGQQGSNGTIVPEEVRAIIDRKDTTFSIIDVRTKAEFESETGHLPGALLIPLDELERRYSELLPLQEKELIIYCKSGRRSAEASRILAGKGFRVRNMEGGILRWIEMEKK